MRVSLIRLNAVKRSSTQQVLGREREGLITVYHRVTREVGVKTLLQDYSL